MEKKIPSTKTLPILSTGFHKINGQQQKACFQNVAPELNYDENLAVQRIDSKLLILSPYYPNHYRALSVVLRTTIYFIPIIPLAGYR